MQSMLLLCIQSRCFIESHFLQTVRGKRCVAQSGKVEFARSRVRILPMATDGMTGVRLKTASGTNVIKLFMAVSYNFS